MTIFGQHIGFMGNQYRYREKLATQETPSERREWRIQQSTTSGKAGGFYCEPLKAVIKA